MKHRVGVSARLAHLAPWAVVVTPSVIPTMDMTFFLAEEEADWIFAHHRTLRPVFVESEQQARTALESLRSWIWPDCDVAGG